MFHGEENNCIPGKVVEVVHDNSHEEIQHDEGTEEDEGDKVEVGHVGATVLAGIYQLS